MDAKTLGKLLAFPVMTGVTFHIAAYVMQHVPVFFAASWRFGIAAVLMLLLLSAREGIRWEDMARNGRLYICLGIIGVFGFNALFFQGMKETMPVNGALIMATNPLCTIFFARLLLGVSISYRQAFGAALSLLGVVLVITNGSWMLLRTLQFSSGDLVIVLGNFCWALYGVLGRKYAGAVSSLALTSYTMAVGAACFLIGSACFPAAVAPHTLPVGVWLGIGFMAVFTTVLGYLWWNEGMAVVGAERAAIFFNLVPVVAMGASGLLGKGITPSQVVGTMLVLGGVVLASGLLSHIPKILAASNR